MTLGGVTPVILGLLAFGPRSGYDVKRIVDRSTRFFWAASYGQIYPELRRLADAGLVEGESAPTGSRRRTVYRLTPAGRDALVAWLHDPDAGSEVRDLGLLKLFFAGALDRAEAVERVRALRRDREAVLERLRAVQASIPASDSGMPELVLEYGLGIHEWQVEWCREAERRLEARLEGGGDGRTTGEEARR